MSLVSVCERAVPVYDFPGDEACDAHYADSILGRYRRYMGVMAGTVAAAEAFDVRLDRPTVETWRRLIPATGLLDDELDGPDRTTAQELYGIALDYLQGTGGPPELSEGADSLLGPALRMLRAAIAELPKQRAKEVVTAARLIGDHSLQKAACDDVDDYIDLLETEAELTAQWVTKSASPAVYARLAYGPFAAWYGDFVIFGTFIDSTGDLRKDYAAGLTSVPPTEANASQLRQATRRSLQALLSTPVGRRATRKSMQTALGAVWRKWYGPAD